MVIEKLANWIKSIVCRDCQETIEKLSKENYNLKIQLKSKIEALEQLQQKYEEDTKYYEDRIRTLNNLLLKSIQMPDLSEYKGKVKKIDPRDYIKIPNSQFADFNYYALDYQSWKEVLTKIQSTFKAVWSSEVFDCDDFALLASAMLAYSVYKSGFDLQLAFGIAWSLSHAFNIFIDSGGTTWIYEPQTDSVVGRIGSCQPPYEPIIEIWFMS